MRRCRTCVLPDTKPDLRFNETGECSACEAFAARQQIDWEARKLEFIDYVKGNSRGAWDCIIPVSGGKDSTYQLIILKQLGFRPLAVTSTTCDLTPVGRRNLRNIGNLGFDVVNKFKLASLPIDLPARGKSLARATLSRLVES